MDSSCARGETCSWFVCKLKDRTCRSRSDCGHGQNCVTTTVWFSKKHMCQYSDDVCSNSRHYEETFANILAKNEQNLSKVETTDLNETSEKIPFNEIFCNNFLNFHEKIYFC